MITLEKKKHGNLLYLNDCYHESEEEKDFSAEASIEMFALEEVSRYRRLEIGQLKKELLEWGITFLSLQKFRLNIAEPVRLVQTLSNFFLQEDLIGLIKKKNIFLLERSKSFENSSKKD